MKHDNAHSRGKGSIGGSDLPMNNSENHAEDMAKSMPGTDMGALESGYSAMGSIASDTKSNPAGMCPGENNKGRANRA